MLTDNEIMIALEHCSQHRCNCECPRYYTPPTNVNICRTHLMESVLDLLKRKNAESEEYPFKCKVGNNSEIHSKSQEDYDHLITDIADEEVKKFANKLKSKALTVIRCGHLGWIDCYDIEETLKERKVMKMPEGYYYCLNCHSEVTPDYNEHCCFCGSSVVAVEDHSNEEVERAFDLLHKEQQGLILEAPCKVGDTVYKIRKFCQSNTGYMDEYKPSVEFEEDCFYFDPQEYMEDVESCRAAEDRDEGDYCSLYLNVICCKCKERFAIQKDKFEYSMMDRVFNTAMYNKNTPLENTLFRTPEEAEQALKEHIEKSEE